MNDVLTKMNSDANNNATRHLKTNQCPKYEEFANDIKSGITNKCNHKWVKDMIDIDPDRSQQICYCIKCEVTKE